MAMMTTRLRFCTLALPLLISCGGNLDGPAISSHPKDVEVDFQEGKATFTVESASANVSYRWMKRPYKKLNPGETKDAPKTVPGATNSTLVYAFKAEDEGAEFLAEVINGKGKARSRAAVLKFRNIPVIFSTHPESQTVNLSATVTFTAKASGNAKYQWQQQAAGDFEDIPGATAESFVIPSAAMEDNGKKFRVVADNGHNKAISNEAVLKVVDPGAFTIKFTAAAGGTLQGNLEQTLSKAGKTTPVKAIPEANHLFNYWLVNGKPVLTEEITLEATGQMEIQAFFVPKAALKIGDLAPNIRGINSKGESVALSNLYGKVIVLDVLAENCEKCMNNAPKFEAKHQLLKGEHFTCAMIMHTSKSGGKAKKESLQKLANITMPLQNDASGSASGYTFKCFVGGNNGASPCYVVLDKAFKVRLITGEMESAITAGKQLSEKP